MAWPTFISPVGISTFDGDSRLALLVDFLQAAIGQKVGEPAPEAPGLRTVLEAAA